MNAKHKLTLACALACSGLAGGVIAAEPGSRALIPLTAEQALEIDAAEVAKNRGITPEAAKARLLVQRAVGPIAERIRTQYADRLAGIYIEHEPSSRLVVRLKGYEAVRPEFHDANGHPLEVAYVVGADRTFAELQQRFDAGFAKLSARVPGIQGGYVDERTGEIVIDVVRDQKAGSLADVQRAVAGHFGVPTRVEELSEPLVNHQVLGSGNLDFVQSGTAIGCTGGFTVETTTGTLTYGTLTAGHCQTDSGIYDYTEAGTVTPITSLAYVARKFDANSDIAWASAGTGSGAVDAFFYANTLRPQTGVLTKASTVANMELCKYGRNTGYGCGLVVSTSYNPGSLCGPGVIIGAGTGACNSVFIRVDGASTLCGILDSGGPWFDVNLAAGIHKAGAGGVCAYTTIDDISALNLTLYL